MTEAEIKAFLAICRCGNMTRAAENLYISQPSLSSRLKTLEREVGQALFYRHKGGRETVLTPKGEEFYRLAVEYEGVLERMQGLCAAKPTKLRVSSIHSVGTYILPPVYDAFMQKYPEVELVIQDLEFEMARKSVVQGFTDANHVWDDLWKEEKKRRSEAGDAKPDRQDFFKVIYGVEAYLVDDLKEIVTNSKNQSLEDQRRSAED